MTIRTRELTHSVAFDRPTEADDGHGGKVTGWSIPEEAILARAKYRFPRIARSGEAVLAARLAGGLVMIVSIRASSEVRTITSAWRMRDLDNGGYDTGGDWTGPVFNVRGPGAITADDRFFELLVESGVAV